MKKTRAFPLLILAAVVFASVLGCPQGDDDDDSGGGSCPEINLDIAVCDPDAGPFSLTIDNDFLPYVVGSHMVLEGEDDEGVTVRVEIDVLDETEEVAGVTTRVVTETEYEDGELIEVSWNWFAQAPDGTVCYFGEAVDDYEDGQVVGHGGSWRAGENGYLPGILMPGDPQIGQVFYQEYAPGVAQDSSEIAAFGEAIDVPAGSFDDTLTALDYNDLEGECDGERKVYIRGIGLAIDEDAELISY